VKKPTLRRGSSGEYVLLAQTELLNKGYSLGSAGVDGKFGSATEKAVKEFQKDNGLTVDGIIGPMTWDALDRTEPLTLYTVTIPHMTKSKADQLLSQYPGAVIVEEGR
jgi:peptidoglycan hydrolase-like protein with peptidoglycan-binding domain